MTPLPPLRFQPIFQPRIWGGRQLARLFGWLPGDEPIGEAWVLSDRDDHPSRVAGGPFAGRTLTEMIRSAPDAILGAQAGKHRRFPLLLKFLDAREALSVQVHPSDTHAHLLPANERGKTEAWVVMHADPGSRIYAGLVPDATPDKIRTALAERKLDELLASFEPKPGDGVMLPAGTVHALGGGIVLFEVQQNSDVTFRLHDWDRIDGKTGKPRALHIEESLACVDFARGAATPVTPVPETTTPDRRERLFDCEFFRVWRLFAREPFAIGAEGACRALVGIQGRATMKYRGGEMEFGPGAVVVWPAQLGVGECRPSGTEDFVLLEIALP
jgi:mannose-6-phosphate isomerase